MIFKESGVRCLNPNIPYCKLRQREFQQGLGGRQLLTEHRDKIIPHDSMQGLDQGGHCSCVRELYRNFESDS